MSRWGVRVVFISRTLTTKYGVYCTFHRDTAPSTATVRSPWEESWCWPGCPRWTPPSGPVPRGPFAWGTCRKISKMSSSKPRQFVALMENWREWTLTGQKYCMSEAVFRVRKLSRSNGRDQMIRDFLLEIFRIHKQFTTGELSQSGGRQRYLYKMYM